MARCARNPDRNLDPDRIEVGDQSAKGIAPAGRVRSPPIGINDLRRSTPDGVLAKHTPARRLIDRSTMPLHNNTVIVQRGDSFARTTTTATSSNDSTR